MGSLGFGSALLKHWAASNLLKSHLTRLSPHTYDYAAKVGVKGITRGGCFKRNLGRTAGKDIFTSIYGEQVQGYLVCTLYTSNFAFAVFGGVRKENVELVGLRETGADNRKRQMTEGNGPKETQQNTDEINCM